MNFLGRGKAWASSFASAPGRPDFFECSKISDSAAQQQGWMAGGPDMRCRSHLAHGSTSALFGKGVNVPLPNCAA